MRTGSPATNARIEDSLRSRDSPSHWIAVGKFHDERDILVYVDAAVTSPRPAPRRLCALALAAAALLSALLAATAAAVPIRDPQVRALRPGFIAGNALAVPAPNAVACGIHSQAKLINADGDTLVRARRRISDGCQTNDRGEATVVFELRFTRPLPEGRYRIVLRAWQRVLPRGVSAHRRAFSLRLPIDLRAAGRDVPCPPGTVPVGVTGACA